MTEAIYRRARELHATGEYRNFTAAYQAALAEAQETFSRQHREYINSLGR